MLRARKSSARLRLCRSRARRDVFAPGCIKEFSRHAGAKTTIDGIQVMDIILQTRLAVVIRLNNLSTFQPLAEAFDGPAGCGRWRDFYADEPRCAARRGAASQSAAQ